MNEHDFEDSNRSRFSFWFVDRPGLNPHSRLCSFANPGKNPHVKKMNTPGYDQDNANFGTDNLNGFNPVGGLAAMAQKQGDETNIDQIKGH